MRTQVHKLTLAIFAAVMLLTLMPGGIISPIEAHAAADIGWYSNPNDITFYISNGDELAGLAQLVNSGNKFQGKTIMLLNNIDLSSYSSSVGWVPIGTTNNEFAGTFDGNGKKITNLTINRPNERHVGLFGRVDTGGTVKNLTIESGDVTGNERVGGVAGVNNGTIESCTNAGDVTGEKLVGGVVGQNYGTIKNCTNNGDVDGSGDNVGGVAGQNSIIGATCGTIESCTNAGDVTGSGNYVGGVAGQNDNGTITNCENGGTVTGIGTVIGSGSYIGGVVGYNISSNSRTSTITNCENVGTVTGTDIWHVGGVAGSNESTDSSTSTITDCTNDGNVTVTVTGAGAGAGNMHVGGVAGSNISDDSGTSTSTVTRCENRGEVSGETHIGGMVGSNEGTIETCYNSGEVSGSGDFVGGVAGVNDGTIEICYNTGEVTGEDCVGGVSGANEDTIESCYNTGEVTGEDCVGGVSGVNDGTIESCYNTGDVSSIGDYVGGVSGVDNGTITDCWRYKNVKVKGSVIEDNGANDIHGGILSAGAFCDNSTYESAGWNFITAWGWDNTELYPKLGIGAESYPFKFRKITYHIDNGTLPEGDWSGYNQGYNFVLPTPTRNGYDFDGWYENSSLTGTAVTEISNAATEHKEYWAKWTLKQYNVTYNVNYGTLPGVTVYTYTYGTGLTLPTPTRNGYDFDGWYENSGLTGTAVTEISGTDIGDKEYWAKWTLRATGGWTVTPLTPAYKYVSIRDSNGVLIADIDTTKSEVNGGVITINLSSQIDAYVLSFNMNLLLELEESAEGGKFKITFDGLEYELSYDIMNIITGFADYLKGANSQEYTLEVTISKLSGDELKNAYEDFKAAYPNSEVPTDFYRISFSLKRNGDKTEFNANEFDEPVTFVLNTGKECNAILEYNPNTGKFSFVPAKFGAGTATAKTRHHSIYAAVNNRVEFDDVPADSWYAPFVTKAGNMALVTGVGGGLFEPDRDVTRAEFVQMVVNAIQLPSATAGTQTYSDADDKNAWYYYAVMRARSADLLDCFTGTFEPDQPITREEIASVLAAVLKQHKVAATMQMIYLDQIFDDYSNMDTARLMDIELVYRVGLMVGTGDGRFEPKGVTTRAQAATVLIRLLEKLDMIDS